MQLEMARNRHRVRKSDRITPTPETLAKLTPDPWLLFVAGKDASIERAGDEIAAVYRAVCRDVMHRARPFGLRVPGEGMSDTLAWAHAQTYLPWVARTGPAIVDWTLMLVVDRDVPPNWTWDAILRALESYASRMKARPEMPVDKDSIDG